jgi:hypothetical protein
MPTGTTTNTAPAAAQQATAAQTAIANFLAYARTNNYPVLQGSILSGSAGGGSSSQVTWQPASIPQIAAFCEEILLFATLPIQLVLPATSGTATVSPYAPYNILASYFSIAGQNQWPAYTPGTPFWLDELTSHNWWDPAFSYPSSYGAISGSWDNGSSQASPGWYPNIDGSGAFSPGTTLTNTTSVAKTISATVQCRLRLRLRRRWPNCIGMVPLGDPENNPQLFVQLGALIGTDPAFSMFTAASASATATLSAAGTVVAVFQSRSTDILPSNVPVPNPAVQMTMQINQITNVSITQAGVQIRVPHRNNLLIDKVFHAVNNANIAQACDYFATWITDDQQSARWYFDAAVGNYQSYFNLLHERYKRYFPVGCLVADWYSGRMPDFPGADPYRGVMTPDSGYAALAQVAVAPLLNTAFRIPSGTSLTSPGIDVWEMGLVYSSY